MISAKVILQRLGAAISRSVLLLTGTSGSLTSQAEVTSQATSQANVEAPTGVSATVRAKVTSTASTEGALAVSTKVSARATSAALTEGHLRPTAALTAGVGSSAQTGAKIAPTAALKSGYVLEGPQVLVASTGAALQTSSGALFRWDRRNLSGILPPLVNAASQLASQVILAIQSAFNLSVRAAGSSRALFAASATAAANVRGILGTAAEVSPAKAFQASSVKSGAASRAAFHVKVVQDGPNLLSTSAGTVFVSSSGAALQFQIKTS